MQNSSIVYRSYRFAEIITARARIDIEEPILVFKGEKKEVGFTYFAGDPFGDRFWLEWYLSEADAWAGENILTEHLPRHRLTPARPFPSEADEADLLGRAEFYVPPDWIYDELYGKIFIRQEGETTRTPIGDPKRQSIGTLMPPRRRHEPTWEIR